MQGNLPKACYRTPREVNAVDGLHNCFSSKGVFRGAQMLVDKDDEQKCCMSRRTTKAYCLYGEEVQRRQTVFMPLDLGHL